MPISNFVTPPPLEGADHWSDWLASTRRLRSERDLADVTRYADRVLDGARLAENHTLLDVGTGEGLVAFRAIERLGPDIRVVASDASSMALAYAASQARELGVAHQIRFVQCTAEHMLEVGASSVNAITTRSVLAYVPDKIAALNEFKRILKPGGKLSMAEPIFQDDAMQTMLLRKLAEQEEHANSPFIRLLHQWKSAQFPDTEEKIRQTAFTNFNERDLVQMMTECGWTDIELNLHIRVRPASNDWEALLHGAPHPFAPSLQDLMAKKFTADEQALFESTIRKILENPSNTSTERMAYLTATRTP